MQWYDYVLEYGPMVVAIVAAIVMFFRTKNVKYIKEIEDIVKYRVSSEKVKGAFTQDFEGTRYVKQYRLNKATNALEECEEPLDVQALVNSCKDYCLQECLNRFFPADDKKSQVVQEYDDTLDDIDSLTEAFNVAEDYREKLGLSDEANITEIFAAMEKRSAELKKYVDVYQAQKNNISEVKENAQNSQSSPQS